jgi:hypothetical protein
MKNNDTQPIRKFTNLSNWPTTPQKNGALKPSRKKLKT